MSGSIADTCVIVVAAGAGARMRSDVRKPYLPLLGRPIVVWTLERINSVPDVGAIVLVVHPDDLDSVRTRLGETLRKEYRVASIVAGGGTRQESVWNGLEALPDGYDAVLVHDAVRPLVRRETVARVAQTVRERGAALAAAPMVATVKESNDDGEVIATPPRERLWMARRCISLPAMSGTP